jgi:hypothetical protein
MVPLVIAGLPRFLVPSALKDKERAKPAAARIV